MPQDEKITVEFRVCARCKQKAKEKNGMFECPNGHRYTRESFEKRSEEDVLFSILDPRANTRRKPITGV